MQLLAAAGVGDGRARAVKLGVLLQLVLGEMLPVKLVLVVNTIGRGKWLRGYMEF